MNIATTDWTSFPDRNVLIYVELSFFLWIQQIIPFVSSPAPEKSVNIISGILVGVLGVWGPCCVCEFCVICWCEFDGCWVCWDDWCCGDVGDCKGCCKCAELDWLTWFVESLAIVVEFKLIFGFESPIEEDICIWFDCIESKPDIKPPSSYCHKNMRNIIKVSHWLIIAKFN